MMFVKQFGFTCYFVSIELLDRMIQDHEKQTVTFCLKKISSLGNLRDLLTFELVLFRSSNVSSNTI